MGRDNHNAAMHYVKYSTRISDADAVAYIQRKEREKEQAITKEIFDEINEKYDKPCNLRYTDMKERVHINYYNENYVLDYPMYHYIVKNAKSKKERKLTLWVGYDLGGKSGTTGEVEARGYYLYFTNKFADNKRSRKLLLFEVQRKSQKDLAIAVEMASVFGKEIISNYCDFMVIDWDNCLLEKHGGVAHWFFMDRLRCFRTIKNCTIEM